MPTSGNIISLQPNKPELLRLKYRTGKPCVSPYKGPQVLFTTVEGAALFVPPSAAEAITQAQIGPGERFTLCMRQNGKEECSWELTRIDPPKKQTAPADAVEKSEPESAGAIVNGCIQKHTGNGVPPQVLTTHHGRQVLQQLIAAIEVVHAAEQYAERMNRPVRFEPADIRALAISAFIQSSREGAM